MASLPARNSERITKEELAGAGSFHILSSRQIETQYGEALVFEVRLPDASERALYLGAGNQQRQDIHQQLQEDPEPIGPVVLYSRLTKGGRTVWVFRDA